MKKLIKDKKENIIIFLIPFIIFLLLFVTFFPGIITYDGNVQWELVQSGFINDSHPFFTTFFMRQMSKIWNNIGIMSIIQILFFSFSWTYICSLIRNYNNKKKIFKIELIITFLISFLPIISIYSITIWKDILYSYYLMLIVFFIYKGIKKEFDYKNFDYIYLGFLLTMVYQYRHNGKIVSILFLLYLLIILFRKKIKFINFIIILTTFIFLDLLILIPKTIYLNEYNKYAVSTDENIEEPISTIDNYIIWMYGSFIRDDVINDKKMLNRLDKIIELEKWKEVYDPFLINSTGFCERDTHFYNQNLSYFRKSFIKQCFKHPLTIIKHYLKADALLWCPFDVGYIYSFDYTDWWPKYEFNNAKQYKYDELSFKLPIVKKAAEKYTSFGLYFPMRLFYRPINSIIISVALLFLLIKQNRKKIYWSLLLPAIFNTISLLPINLAQDLRYVYINYLTLIVIVLIFFCEYNFEKLLKRLKR